MDRRRLLASIVATFVQFGAVLASGPLSDLRGCLWPCGEEGRAPHWVSSQPWTPHFENLGEGRPDFLGPRCPGRQQVGAPFRLDDAPLPEGFDPHAYPDTDVIACVRIDSGGSIEAARLEGGSGSPALDRRLLRTLYRQWRAVPVDSVAGPGLWQRVRLNSARRHSPPPDLPDPPPLR